MNQPTLYEWISTSPQETDFSHAREDREQMKKIPFATARQLRNWYETENGRHIVSVCILSKNYKTSWKSYATKYNLANEKKLGWKLQTTVDGIILAFGIKKYNAENFQRLLAGESAVDQNDDTDHRIWSATRERLLDWYRNDGETIIEACKASDDPATTWKERTETYNQEHIFSQDWQVPTTIRGVMYIFWVKTSSFYNLVRLLSGKELTEEEKTSSRNKYRATREQLLAWYGALGRKVIEDCRKSGNFARSWRAYADAYNKKEFYDSGYRLPNNKVGLGTDLGTSEYSIPEIVRIFEGLSDISEVPKIEKEVRAKMERVILRVKKEAPPHTPKPPKEKPLRTPKPPKEKPKRKVRPEKKTLPDTAPTKEALIIPDTIVLQEAVKEDTASLLRRKRLERQISGMRSCEVHEEPEKEPKEKTEQKERSAWMIDFQGRFPNFLELHQKYYIVFRKFIQSLERAYPTEGGITGNHVKVSVDGRGVLHITVEKAFLYNSNASYIFEIFEETRQWYATLLEQSKKLPFIEMDLHIEL